MLAEFQLRRKASTVQSAQRIFAIGAVAFLPFMLPGWLAGEVQLWFTLEWLAVALGAVAMWVLPSNRPELGARALLTAYGLVAFFAMLQFGPNMGVGVISFSWLMMMAALQDYRWLGVGVFMGTYVGAGILDLAGVIGDSWYVEMTVLDWVRSASLICVVAIGAVIAMGRIKRELGEAWQREATAVAERIETERALMQSQRLEAIGKLAGGVAHDFNNSLSVLVGGIESLHKLDDKTERDDTLKHMEQAARGAVATTRQLLSLSSQGSEPGKPGNPRQALEALVPNLERLFPETIEIRASFEDTPYVPLSSGALEQTVLNLCLNARDAMPHGGVMHISCKLMRDTVQICVSDTGSGMDAETRSRALTEFFTTKQAGTGLGLSMVQRTVEHAGGRVEIDSEPGSGTTCRLLLPMIATPEELEHKPANLEPVPPGQHVLLIEDNLSVLTLFEKMLGLQGYQVTSAVTVSDALARIAETDFDVLVTDAVLPDGEPGQAVKAFREKGWKPVLVVSGYIDSEDLVQDLSHGDYRFLQKPFTNEQLETAMMELREDAVERLF